MSRHGARQQRQLAKKKAKRNEKRTELARLHSADPTVLLQSCGDWPIFAALVSGTGSDQGLRQVLLARRAPDGRLACAVYLVDVFCLGVKTTYWRFMTLSQYREHWSKVNSLSPLKSVAPEFLAKLVWKSVEYAQSFGFAPDPDFRHTWMLLAGIDPSLCTDHIEFGKDGKPFYIRGPHESLAKAHLIANRIKEAGGEYLIPLDEGSDLPGLKGDTKERLAIEDDLKE